MGVVTYTTFNGEIASETRDGVSRAYAPESLGSTVALYDESGNITDTWEYWPYGEVRTRTGTTPTPFQYVGTLGYYTDLTGNLYVRARSYQPKTTRWMSVDPLWPHESAYGYAGAGPISSVDPTGLWVEVCARRLIEYPGDSVAYGHWFISTSRCGAHGFESQGLLRGWKGNAGRFKVNCYLIPATPKQEACLCEFISKNYIYFGGQFWVQGPHGSKFGDASKGQYNWRHHNCQDYVQIALHLCFGKTLPWPEMGKVYCPYDPPLPVTRNPRCPH